MRFDDVEVGGGTLEEGEQVGSFDEILDRQQSLVVADAKGPGSEGLIGFDVNADGGRVP